MADFIDPKHLSEVGIHQWDEGFGEFFEGSDIFLGNGFSINICERLNYKRLFEIFSRTANPVIIKIFSKLDTSNFEYVIEALRLSRLVNRELGKDYEDYATLIEEIKEGLINCIKETHPTFKETNFRLMESLAVEFLQFKDIYTTNYDVFLYRIVLATKELIESGKSLGVMYHDDFYEKISPTQLGFSGSYDDSLRKIYYLHGSLFFYRKHIQTYKLRKIDEIEYINLIRKEISGGNLPVFVAEGSSNDKQLAINNNSYLSLCSDKLKSKRGEGDDKLIVYGFSFSAPDYHLVQMINTSGVKHMAVSLWPGTSLEELNAEKSRINSLFGKVEVTFFDSRSLFNFNGGLT